MGQLACFSLGSFVSKQGYCPIQLLPTSSLSAFTVAFVFAIVHAKITFLYGERLCTAMQEEQQFQDKVCSEAANRNKDPGELKDEGLDLFF